MSVTGSPFCKHGKLRTGCAACKAAHLPAVDPGLASTPFRSRDEDPPKQKTQKKLGGPAKPLMPTRRAKTAVTAKEAESAQAWWVKK